METIQKILRYKFTEEQKLDLYQKGIVNGCGGKGGINFEKIMYDQLVNLPNFLQEKSEKLFFDIKELCIEHDYDFYLGGGVYSYVKSNFLFARGVFLLTHWSSYMSRLILFMIIFSLLCYFGRKYFTFKGVLAL